MQIRKTGQRPLNMWMGAVAVAGAVLAASPALAQTGDTLRIALNAGSPFLGNPFQTRGSQPVYFMHAIYDSPTLIDPQGKVTPGLLDSWRTIDEKTWQVKLKAGGMFSNGKPNDAANFAKNLAYLQTDAGKALQIGRLFLEVESTRVIDATTLEILTKSPQPLLPATFSELFLVEADAWASMGAADYAKSPVSSGPWKPVTWSTDGFTGTAYDKAFRPSKFRNISIIALPEAVTRIQALASDQVDFITNVAPDDVAKLRAAGHQAEVSPAPVTLGLAFYEQRQGFNPFKDRRVRLAANMAIDRNAMVNGLMPGLAQPAHQAATPQTRGYDPTIPAYPYDPEQAKRLLAEAGYPNGFETALQFTTGSHPFANEIWTLVGDSLSKIGIRTTVLPVALSDLVNMLRKTGGREFEGLLFSYPAYVDPHLDGTRPFENHGCAYQPPWICIPAVEDLKKKANAEFDEAKRLALLKQLIRTSHDEATMLHVMHDADIFGVNKRLTGFTNWNRRIILENFAPRG